MISVTIEHHIFFHFFSGIWVKLHHLYRAMAFLGEEIPDQKDKTSFSPRCTKDIIEENLFRERRDLFTGLDMVFFDTTSIYFEGTQGVRPWERRETARITVLILTRW